MKRRQSRRGGGFTLVELLVVIGIIAILVGILIPVVSRVRTQAQVTATNARMVQISSAIQAYFMEWQAYPGSFPNSAWVPTVSPALFKPTDSSDPKRALDKLTSTEELVL